MWHRDTRLGTAEFLTNFPPAPTFFPDIHLGETQYAVVNWSGNGTISFFYECTTCLTSNSGIPGLDTSILSNFNSSRLPYAAGILLRIGPFDYFYDYSGPSGEFVARVYSSSSERIHQPQPFELPDTPYYFYLEPKFHTKPVPLNFEIEIAHLVARLPILAIIGAERELPRKTRDPNATSADAYIVTNLKVKWPRAFGILAGLVAGQVLVIGVAAVATRNVPIRDHDSLLSVARLLRTAMEKIEGRSMASGEELAECIERELRLGEGMRYGTEIVDEGTRRVDLWEGM